MVSARPAARQHSQTVGEWLRAIEAQFTAAPLHFGHGTHNARDEAAWLVAHVLNIPFAQLAARLELPVGRRAARLASVAAARVASRKPLAYLLREAWLGEYRFYVDERVIVPRSFIAELLRDPRAPWLQGGPPITRVLDLCTGSGCLAIVAAHRWPDATVDAVDLSADAVAVARRNVRAYRLDDSVRVMQSDLFAAVGDSRYDLILTNPPYVNAQSMRRLPREYRHEPEMALAGGRDGLDLVRRIVAAADTHLTHGAWIALEIGHNRPAMARAFGAYDLHWLDTSAGADLVCAMRAPLARKRPSALRSRHVS